MGKVLIMRGLIMNGHSIEVTPFLIFNPDCVEVKGQNTKGHSISAYIFDFWPSKCAMSHNSAEFFNRWIVIFGGV